MNYSPLRYPGGKSKLAPLVKAIINNNLENTDTYIEPFAGGAGVALSLLFDGVVERIVLNDYDKAIYSIWKSIYNNSDEFIDRIYNTPLTIDEWRNQKRIYIKEQNKYSFELGFAAFYLNRTNRSGILSAGPIGGYSQEGTYLIDARFNREALASRISKIAQRKHSILIYNQEINTFISRILPKYIHNAFIYFDPPYYKNGKRLYKKFFMDSDHARLREKIKDIKNWIITYDNIPEIVELYDLFDKRLFSLNHSAANKGYNPELVIFSSPTLIPRAEQLDNPKFQLITPSLETTYVSKD